MTYEKKWGKHLEKDNIILYYIYIRVVVFALFVNYFNYNYCREEYDNYIIFNLSEVLGGKQWKHDKKNVNISYNNFDKIPIIKSEFLLSKSKI